VVREAGNRGRVLRDTTERGHGLRRGRPAPGADERGVIADERIVLTSPSSAAKYEQGRPLRRVEVELADGERLIFLTNHLGLGPTTIARIYKDRWQIELFFKTLN
jgi:Transposase DDE domain